MSTSALIAALILAVIVCVVALVSVLTDAGGDSLDDWDCHP